MRQNGHTLGWENGNVVIVHFSSLRQPDAERSLSLVRMPLIMVPLLRRVNDLHLFFIPSDNSNCGLTNPFLWTYNVFLVSPEKRSSLPDAGTTPP